MTPDFRRVSGTMIEEWLGYADTGSILKGDFQPLGVFGGGAGPAGRCLRPRAGG